MIIRSKINETLHDMTPLTGCQCMPVYAYVHVQQIYFTADLFSSCQIYDLYKLYNSNMTSFFHFVDKQAIYRLGIISLAHAPVHVTDLSVINVHVDELSARIWQHKLCATFSTNVNINYRLPIKVYYRICTLRHIRIEIRQPMLKLKTHSGFHDLFLN